MIRKIADLEKDDRSALDSLLNGLSSGRLADRIANAARLAVAQHMLLQAQQMQSAVETENSAQ